MKDRDCDFLRPHVPQSKGVLPEHRSSTADLVRLWAKSGVITKARRTSYLTVGDFVGLLALVAALAFSVGYYLAR